MIIYIIYRNKADNFEPYVKQFETVKQALKWGKKQISNFNPDMIKIKFNNTNNLNPLQNENRNN